MVDLSYVNDPNLAVYYVDVYDSAEAPVLFAREQTARQWALEHHPDWKVDSEMVRQRWEAGESYKGAVEEARAGGCIGQALGRRRALLTPQLRATTSCLSYTAG